VVERTGIIGEVHIKKQILSCECEDEGTAKKHFSTLSPLLKEHGYTISEEKQDEIAENDGLIWQALPLGLVILMFFFILQKSGILNFSVNGNITPTTSFLVGLIASISSCLAIV